MFSPKICRASFLVSGFCESRSLVGAESDAAAGSVPPPSNTFVSARENEWEVNRLVFFMKKKSTFPQRLTYNLDSARRIPGADNCVSLFSRADT